MSRGPNKTTALSKEFVARLSDPAVNRVSLVAGGKFNVWVRDVEAEKRIAADQAKGWDATYFAEEQVG